MPGDIVSYRQGRADFGTSVVLDPVAEDLRSNYPMSERTIPTRSTGGGAYSWVDPAWVYEVETLVGQTAKQDRLVAAAVSQAAFTAQLESAFDDEFEDRYGERTHGTEPRE